MTEIIAITTMPAKGDVAWMLVATALVLLMALPGLALFYGGLVRSKNMLSVLTQVIALVGLAAIFWVAFGYSMTFTGGSPFIGGLDKAFLRGVDATSLAGTFSPGVVIPEYIYMAFQMTFACITPALIVGAFAERVRFSAVLLFAALWLPLVYFPMAHMVWYWPGPDAMIAAAQGGESSFAQALAQAGLLFQWGALDFAGGAVVHINSGVAALVGAIMVGKRIGYGRESMAPHSMTMTLVGAALLWVGWFGFNVGSNLEANGLAGLVFVNTFVAAAAATVAWLLVEAVLKGRPSLLGAVSGMLSGLVAVTPAAGFVGPMGSLILGLLAAPLSFFFCTKVKYYFDYDDSLDVFGIHGVAGIFGALATGILVAPALGGEGIADYLAAPGSIVFSFPGYAEQLWVQTKAVLVTVVWSGLGSAVIFFLVDKIVGLRVSADEEREGLDLSTHGERAYHY